MKDLKRECGGWKVYYNAEWEVYKIRTKLFWKEIKKENGEIGGVNVKMKKEDEL